MASRKKPENPEEQGEMTAEMLKLVEVKEGKETKLGINLKIYIKVTKRRLDT